MFLKKIIFFIVLNFLFLSNLHATFLEIDIINHSSYTLSIKDISLRKGTVVKKEFYDNNLELRDNEIILPQTKAIILVEHLEEEFTEITPRDIFPGFWYEIYDYGQFCLEKRMTKFEEYFKGLRRGAENFLKFLVIKEDIELSENLTVGWFSCSYNNRKEEYKKYLDLPLLKYNYFCQEDIFKKSVKVETDAAPFKRYFLLNGEEKQTELGANIIFRDYEVPSLNIIN